MKESTLLKIALIGALVGIFIILFISEKIDLSESNIANITKSNLDQKVKIRGLVTKSYETPGLLILSIKDNTGTISVVVFKEENLTIDKNHVVEIYGTVTEYKEQIEILADEIRVY